MKTVNILPGLMLTSVNGKDAWLHAAHVDSAGGSVHGAIALNELQAPLVRQAFMGWAQAQNGAVMELLTVIDQYYEDSADWKDAMPRLKALAAKALRG